MVANMSDIGTDDAELEYLHRVFDVQKAAYKAHPMPSANERIAHLKALKKVLLNNTENICDAVSEDFSNRCRSETKLAEIVTILEGISYLIKNVKSWMKPSKRKVPLTLQPAKAKVLYQPLGVVGIISPWNYPVFLTFGPLMTALAAGNRAIVKMSEFTPRTGQLIKKMLAETFNEDQVAIVNGEANVGIAFSQKPWDHLLFTGSTSVGKHVMRAAAENLTPITLELGGKSPAIIGPTATMKDASERIAFGKCMNAGQTCVAPDYVLCPENRVDEFITHFTASVSTMYPSLKDNDDYTAVINSRQLTRLKGYLVDAKEKDARIIEINPANENFDNSQKLPLTLVLDVNDQMKIMQDEIFGPLLIVIPYKSLSDAVSFVNDRPRPLALYYFDYDKSKQKYVMENTHSGGACLNDTISQVAMDDIPFGGIGPSGMGHYHGHEGFLTFSKAKSIVIKGKVNSTKFAYPPWNKPIHNILFKQKLG